MAPKTYYYKVQSQISVLGENYLVSAHILPGTTVWNKSLVLVFNEDGAEMILDMSISPLSSEDRIVWRCTNDR